MKNLQAYRDQLKELTRMIDRLERGELSIQELLDMEKLTADLHAKSVILRYKAFEVKVHGEEVAIVVEKREEMVITQPAPEEIVEESPAIDFSIFDAEDDSVEIENESSIIEEESEIEEQEEVIVDEINEEPEKEEPEPVRPAAPPVSGTSFWEQVKTDDDSLSSRFAGSKLDTLIGAFGLNEKLRYINELFDGSSEMFSDAIKMLDSQADFSAATYKVNELASAHGWDPEEESVAEFMIYVKRRYA